MTKLSFTSRMFEWAVKLIWPGDSSKLKQPRRIIGNVLIWVHTTRRRIYYSILNDWGNYGYGVTRDEDGEEKEGAKVTLTGFILWTVSGTVRGTVSHIYIRSGLAPRICKRYGHKVVDYSSGGPDSGNADHACIRCGVYWHRPLY
jgi:hypothetical protein